MCGSEAEGHRDTDDLTQLGGPGGRESRAYPIPIRALVVGALVVGVLSFLCVYLGTVTQTWDPAATLFL